MTIKVRLTQFSDTPALKAIYDQKSVYSNTLFMPETPLAEWEKRIGNIPENVHSFVAEIDGKVVGNIALTVNTHACLKHSGMIAMGVAESHQGQGVGSAMLAHVIDLADNWLNLKRIELMVYTHNEVAIGLYKKHGFIIEGEAKAQAFRNGKYVDAYYMARVT